MKLRAVGTGSPFCRWPLIPACWLIQTHDSNVLIGCPPSAGARLELLGLSLDKIDIIVPLGTRVSDIGGLEEFSAHFSSHENRPYLVAPERLLSKVVSKFDKLDGLQVKAVKNVGIKEEHLTEIMTFVPNQNGSFGFRLENAKVYCSGHGDVSEETIALHSDCDIVLHEDRPQLLDLPVYVQNKIWIFGYQRLPEGSDPLPMLFMPQSAWIYDSDRRDKIMAKERYIRENSKRIVGNEFHK